MGFVCPFEMMSTTLFILVALHPSIHPSPSCGCPFDVLVMSTVASKYGTRYGASLRIPEMSKVHLKQQHKVLDFTGSNNFTALKTSHS